MVCEGGPSVGSSGRSGRSRCPPGWWPRGPARPGRAVRRGVGRVQLRALRAQPQRSLAAAFSPCGGRGRATFRSRKVSGDLTATFPGTVPPPIPLSRSIPAAQPRQRAQVPVPHPRFSQVCSWVLAKKLCRGCAEAQQSPSRRWEHRRRYRDTVQGDTRCHERVPAEGWVLPPHLVASWGPWPLGSGKPGFPSSSEAPW